MTALDRVAMGAVLTLTLAAASSGHTAAPGGATRRPVGEEEPLSVICRNAMPHGFDLQERVMVEPNRAGNASFRTVWRVNPKTGALGPPATQRRWARGVDLSESSEERWQRQTGEHPERLELLMISCPNSSALEKSLELLFRVYAAVPVEVGESGPGDRTWLYEGGHSATIVAVKGNTLARAHVSSRSADGEVRRAIAEDLVRRALPVK